MNDIISKKITDGVSFHLIKTEKFKTNLLSLYIKLPVLRENITVSALLPMVLRRGSEKYPSLSALSKKCEELYGASLYCGLRKKGDFAFLYFSLEFVSEEYISEKTLCEAFSFLKEVVFNPKTENGIFDARFVDSEKENLLDNINGIINDKKEYADLRVKEISFKNSTYGLSPFGYKEDIAGITPEGLYSYYKKVLNECKIDIFLSGTFDQEEASKLIENEFSEHIKPRTPSMLHTAPASRDSKAGVNRITEEMSITQSKLCMSLYTNADPFSDDYYASAVFNCIFGGSPFSKLFNNVREKLSLAYYVSSRLDRHKACMLMSAGIENDKFEAAFDEIILWLDKMKHGDFTDGEIISAKKYLETNLTSIKDSLRSYEDYLASALTDGRTPETPDELIKKLNGVTREQIIHAASQTELDTVYLLTGSKNQEEA